MSANPNQDFSAVWQEVKQWPTGQRLALASRILQSLEQEGSAAGVSTDRKQALEHLIGIWQTDHPPSDHEVEQAVAEERMKKYG